MLKAFLQPSASGSAGQRAARASGGHEWLGWSGLPRDTVQTSGGGSSVTLSGRSGPVSLYYVCNLVINQVVEQYGLDLGYLSYSLKV